MGPQQGWADLSTQMTWGDSRESTANGTQLANLDIFMELLVVAGDGTQLELPPTPRPTPWGRGPSTAGLWEGPPSLVTQIPQSAGPRLGLP